MEKCGGCWWLVILEGYLFWLLGVNVVIVDGSWIYVEGCELMFVELLVEGELLVVFFGEGDDCCGVVVQVGWCFGYGCWFDFFGVNCQCIVFQVSVDQFVGEWCQCILECFLVWGFNSFGNWSDLVFVVQMWMFYSLLLLIVGDYVMVSSGFDWWGVMFDFFDLCFVMVVECVIVIVVCDYCDDFWLFGYYVDNELVWVGCDGLVQVCYGFVFGVLMLFMDSLVKCVFVK